MNKDPHDPNAYSEQMMRQARETAEKREKIISKILNTPDDGSKKLLDSFHDTVSNAVQASDLTRALDSLGSLINEIVIWNGFTLKIHDIDENFTIHTTDPHDQKIEWILEFKEPPTWSATLDDGSMIELAFVPYAVESGADYSPWQLKFLD